MEGSDSFMGLGGLTSYTIRLHHLRLLWELILVWTTHVRTAIKDWIKHNQKSQDTACRMWDLPSCTPTAQQGGKDCASKTIQVLLNTPNLGHLSQQKIIIFELKNKCTTMSYKPLPTPTSPPAKPSMSSLLPRVCNKTPGVKNID